MNVPKGGQQALPPEAEDFSQFCRSNVFLAMSMFLEGQGAASPETEDFSQS